MAKGGGMGKILIVGLVVAGGYYAYKKGLFSKLTAGLGGGGSKVSKSSGSYGSYAARRRAFLGQLNTGNAYQDSRARGAGI
jgi:hypothetical protein